MTRKTGIGLVLMFGFGSLLLLSFGEQVGGYMTFEEAAESRARAHVVGAWEKDKATTYDPSQNRFTFYMRDEAGTVRRVTYANPKPASFEDAEKVVVEGTMHGEEFVAEYILLKCPSKYNNTKGPELTARSSFYP